MENRIALQAKKLIEDIKEYCRSQKDAWQKIPLLALEADGRTGYLDNRLRAYTEKLWALAPCVNGGCYTVYVDLENGELVSPHDTSCLARDEDILILAMHPELLDAAAIAAALALYANEPVHPAVRQRTAEEIAELRKGLLQKARRGPASYQSDD